MITTARANGSRASAHPGNLPADRLIRHLATIGFVFAEFSGMRSTAARRALARQAQAGVRLDKPEPHTDYLRAYELPAAMAVLRASRLYLSQFGKEPVAAR
jgi:hypothetical protein